MSKASANKQQYRVDPMIVNFLIVMILLGAGALAFRYHKIEPVPVVDFEIISDNMMAGQMIQFENQTLGEHRYVWNFGDSSKVSLKRSPRHVFISAGEYSVSLLVDGKYSTQKDIVIKEVPKKAPEIVLPTITGSSSVQVGKTIMLTCNTAGAKTFEWYMGESTTPDSYKKSVTYEYRRGGTKTVTLIVNGDKKHKATKKIYVKKPERPTPTPAPMPVTPPPIQRTQPVTITPVEKKAEVEEVEEVVVKPHEVGSLPSDAVLQKEFVAIVKGEGDQSKFENYLLKGPDDLIVVCNGDLMSLNKAIEKMKEVENFFVKTFYTARQDNSHIIKLTIKYRRDIFNL